MCVWVVKRCELRWLCILTEAIDGGVSTKYEEDGGKWRERGVCVLEM